MKNALFACLFAPFLAAAQKIQLAPPQLRLADGSDLFFEKRAEARLVFDLEGAEIRFTIDGSEPTEKSPKADGSLVFRKSTTLRASSFHPDFEKSDAREWSFFRVQKKMQPDTFWLREPPSAGYEKIGAAALFDLKKGAENNFGDGRWLGFEGKNAVLAIVFRKKRRISKIRLHCLADEMSWIFPPKSAAVFFAQNAVFQPAANGERFDFRIGPNQKGSSFFDLDLKKRQRTDSLLVVVEPFGPLPEGHAGAGKPAWLFLDEIIFEK